MHTKHSIDLLVYEQRFTWQRGRFIASDCEPETVVTFPFVQKWDDGYLCGPGYMPVRCVYPCERCQRPIAALRLEYRDDILFADAIEGSSPGLWTASPFRPPHQCPEVQP